MMLLRLLLCCFLVMSVSNLYGQEEAGKVKDNSKPTNVYSQVDNFFDAPISPNSTPFGYIPTLSSAPNEDNSLTLELPFLFSTKTDRVGLGDIRVRYFYIPYRD